VARRMRCFLLGQGVGDPAIQLKSSIDLERGVH